MVDHPHAATLAAALCPPAQLSTTASLCHDVSRLRVCREEENHIGSLLVCERRAGVPYETGGLNHGHRNGEHAYQYTLLAQHGGTRIPAQAQNFENSSKPGIPGVLRKVR